MNSKNTFYKTYGKRFFDVVISFIAILIASPIFIIIFVMIRFSSKGPFFYRSIRVGKDGKHFSFYKFRTMYIDADKHKQELNELNERNGPIFKIINDPRVTLVGFFLRKFSLDELPQLWNVLKGDMSFVGPRPPIPNEVKDYNIIAKRRLEIKPGITGYWQIKGRAAIPFEEGVELDIYYIENLSFKLDLVIILKTIPAVILGVGAY